MKAMQLKEIAPIDAAPLTSREIWDLAAEGFYDGLDFHRVVPNFVIQGGDPTGTGSGGSTLGYFDDQYHLELQHNRTGVLSYAKSTDDTNDSQFFITEGPQRFLDFNHSVFGQLVEGESNRDAIMALGAIAKKAQPFDAEVVHANAAKIAAACGVPLFRLPSSSSCRRSWWYHEVDEQLSELGSEQL